MGNKKVVSFEQKCPTCAQPVERGTWSSNLIVELEREENGEVKKGSLSDWLVENFNGLPVHEKIGGRAEVAVPLELIEEMFELMGELVSREAVLESALNRIQERGSELEAKIARDALNAPNE